MSILNEIRERLLKLAAELLSYGNEDPNTYLILVTLGCFVEYVQEGLFEEALELLEGAYPGEMGTSIELLFLGEMYLLVGQEEKALDKFERGIALGNILITEDQIKNVRFEYGKKNFIQTLES